MTLQVLHVHGFSGVGLHCAYLVVACYLVFSREFDTFKKSVESLPNPAMQLVASSSGSHTPLQRYLSCKPGFTRISDHRQMSLTKSIITKHSALNKVAIGSQLLRIFEFVWRGSSSMNLAGMSTAWQQLGYCMILD